ncbi:MAG TPA: polysaccharide deacetylase family protein [Solirubrobacterales bacterium]|nr:polysaccharide deacetylase family protein [Solirubrobacterales bacterium]
MSDVLALCYHAVSDDWPAGFAVPAGHIERQVGSLLERGYVGTTFSTAISSPPADRTFAVTFDDAYRSVYELARPVLASLGVPATVFVPTALVGSERPMAWPGTDQWLGTPHEDELTPMSWDELGELTELGWELGSHSRTHPRLPTLAPATLQEELEGSRADLEERTGAPCGSIAYPYGDYDAGVVAASRRAGFTAGGALAGRVRKPGAMLWPRVGVYGKDGAARFRIKASPAMRRLRATHLWRARFLLRRLR